MLDNFCSREQSEQLVKLGFKDEAIAFYDGDRFILGNLSNYLHSRENCCVAPLKSQAFDFLLKEGTLYHKVSVLNPVTMTYEIDSLMFDLDELDNKTKLHGKTFDNPGTKSRLIDMMLGIIESINNHNWAVNK